MTLLLSPDMTPTEGRDSRFVTGLVREAIARTGLDEFFTDDLHAELHGLWGECRESNWGGDDEAPLDPSAAVHASGLIERLPASIRRPELVPEPDGSLGMSWRLKPGHELILSFDGNGNIHFVTAANDAGRLKVRENGYERANALILDHHRLDDLIP